MKGATWDIGRAKLATRLVSMHAPHVEYGAIPKYKSSGDFKFRSVPPYGARRKSRKADLYSFSHFEPPACAGRGPIILPLYHSETKFRATRAGFIKTLAPAVFKHTQNKIFSCLYKKRAASGTKKAARIRAAPYSPSAPHNRPAPAPARRPPAASAGSGAAAGLFHKAFPPWRR